MPKLTEEQAATVRALDILIEYTEPEERLYKYVWGRLGKAFCAVREAMKGRPCRMLARGGMNSCMIQFVDTGKIEIVSRNAIRKIK